MNKELTAYVLTEGGDLLGVFLSITGAIDCIRLENPGSQILWDPPIAHKFKGELHGKVNNKEYVILKTELNRIRYPKED